ncbi:hypothetical protein BU15DRAFT_68889 [Melanogaster broomeanus]|nr:hypothetical protein BU15DRAFT_68889 [Melanogaster broomeanus]
MQQSRTLNFLSSITSEWYIKVTADGPLSKEELRAADHGGFVQVHGFRRLSHMRSWPEKYAKWADERLSDIAAKKDSALATRTCPGELIHSAEVQKCLKYNWDTGLHSSVRDLLLTVWRLFVSSRTCPYGIEPHTQVKHRDFVDLLDKWLEGFSGDEERFSNCPFLYRQTHETTTRGYRGSCTYGDKTSLLQYFSLQVKFKTVLSHWKELATNSTSYRKAKLRPPLPSITLEHASQATFRVFKPSI